MAGHNKEDNDKKTTGFILQDGCTQLSCVYLGLIIYDDEAPMR